MFTRLSQILTGTEEKRRLGSNILSLGILQSANYILPLLTLPYLVRVLGPDYFGVIAFSTATIIYFTIITDYGFNLSATRQISINRDDPDKVTEIFSAVMTIKTVLMIVCFALLLLLVSTVEKFRQEWALYLITFGMVLGQVLFPVWLFQGMERMKYITYLNVSAKLFFTICIFIFVQEQSDYWLVPLLTSLGFIFAGIWSLYLVKKQFKISFVFQSTVVLKEQLYDGWHVFLSSFSISLYTTTTIVILGLVSTNSVVGYFAAADKIVQAVKGIYSPVSQAIYPLISKKIYHDEEAGVKFLRKVFYVVGGGMLLISLMLFFFAELIVDVMLGQQYSQSVAILQIMAFIPFIVAMSNVFGIQMMLNLGYQKEFNIIITSSAFIGLLLAYFLVPTYLAVGSASALLIVELIIVLLMFYFVCFKSRIRFI